MACACEWETECIRTGGLERGFAAHWAFLPNSEPDSLHISRYQGDLSAPSATPGFISLSLSLSA
jgi:hypothetical protein